MAHDWKLLDTKTICSDPWGTVFRKTYRVGRGHPDQEHITVQKREFALIAALDDAQNVLLVRQYRHGTDRSYWALPGGFIEEGETPCLAAQRELLEETGYSAARATLIAVLHPLPAFAKTAAHIVLCEELRHIPDAVLDEEIETNRSLPLATAVQRIFAGEIDEMQAVSAILLVNEFLRRRAGK